MERRVLKTSRAPGCCVDTARMRHKGGNVFLTKLIPSLGRVGLEKCARMITAFDRTRANF